MEMEVNTIMCLDGWKFAMFASLIPTVLSLTQDLYNIDV